MELEFLLGDCRAEIKNLDDDSVDSVVTDPPYELGFMGKAWDSSGVAYDVDLWKEVLRVLRPGGYLLSFGGTRTYHRMACAIEDAGFEIRDCLMWLYSGFPKSMDIGKAMRKLDPVPNIAATYEGFGTALKPAHEPIVMARKPLSEKNVVQNIIKNGVGGINVGACRFGDEEHIINRFVGGAKPWGDAVGEEYETVTVTGRFPANVMHDGNVDLPAGAASFYYSPKCSKTDKNEGLSGKENTHVTVKPTELMKYLCTLVTPPGGTVLDPFMGSGSTGKAAVLCGFGFIGIEQNEDYMRIATERVCAAFASRNSVENLDSAFNGVDTGVK